MIFFLLWHLRAISAIAHVQSQLSHTHIFLMHRYVFACMCELTIIETVYCVYSLFSRSVSTKNSLSPHSIYTSQTRIYTGLLVF